MQARSEVHGHGAQALVQAVEGLLEFQANQDPWLLHVLQVRDLLQVGQYTVSIHQFGRGDVYVASTIPVRSRPTLLATASVENL